ncbi:MAG: hypothetical protein RL660_3187 [Bacteroidota bacterium]|jgi:hypothetical protein
MKNLLQKLILAVACIAFTATASAQRTCGTMDVHDHLMQHDAAYQAARQAIAQQYALHQADIMAGRKTRIQVTIPVVFHVVYQNATENIPDAQLLANLTQLNEDFAKLNADTNLVPTPFKAFHANTDIQFCLAVRDPQGNTTTGITRTQTTVNSFSTNNNVKFNANGGKDAWPRDSYLNIWVADLGSSLLGYAQFPGGGAATDGVVCNYNTVGSLTVPGTNTGYDRGRTLTHEVGHWLDLFHIWGDDNGACTGSDQVGDTPNQEDANYGCPTYPLLDACTGTNPGVMFMNYMDYTDDICMHMFTEGQKTRMQSLFAPGGDRVALLASQGCIPIAPCVGMPTAGTASSSIDTIFCQNSLVLNVAGSSLGTNGITLQWQSSTDNVTWTNIAGGIVNNFSVPTSSMVPGNNYYRVVVTCSTSNMSANSTAAIVYKTGITGVLGDTVCNAGATNLLAQNATGTVNWYSDAAGTNLLFSGNPYATVISGNSTIYANTVTQNKYQVGPINGSMGTFNTSSNFNTQVNGLVFTAFQNLTIDTVFIYTRGTGTVLINLEDNATGNTLTTYTHVVSVANDSVKTPIPVNFSCTGGVTYNINASGTTGVGLFRNTSGFTYPYSVPGVISITGPVSPNPVRYAYYYDWRISTSCSTPLVPVNLAISGVTLNASATNSTCAGATGSITANATGGTGIQYSLNGAAPVSSGSFTSLAAGAYTVTASNSVGCTTSTSLNIITPSAVNVSLSMTPATGGSNGSISATASGGTAPYLYSLNGSPFGFASNFNNLTAGFYTVCAQDANLCTSCNAIVVTNPTVVLVTASVLNLACATSNLGVVDVVAFSGQAPYTYSINGGAFQPSSTFSNLAAGIYTVTAQDLNGASATTTVTVGVSTIAMGVPAVTYTTASPCVGTIAISASGGTLPLTYSVNGLPTPSTATALCGGTYTIAAIDANGCSVTQTAVVPIALPLTFGPFTLVQPCAGATNGQINATTTGGIAPISYSIGGGFGTSGSFSGLAGAAYTITAQDAFGVSISTVVPLNVSSNLAIGGSQTGAIICVGVCDGVATATLTNGAPGFTYSLNGGAGQPSGVFSNLCAGTYTVLGTDANGCTSSTAIAVTQPAVALVLSTIPNHVKCIGDPTGSVTLAGLGGVGPYTYALNNGQYSSSGQYNNLTAGIYTVYVKDNNGCTYSTFTTITQSATVLTLAAAATPSSGGNNGMINATAGGGTAPYTYALNGGVSQSSGSFTGLANGSYTVSATDAAGCIRTYVLQVVSPESLTDIQFAKDISLYPNPAHDYIQLNIQDGASAVQISITNAIGQTVARDYAFATGSGVSKRISTAHLAAGTYNMLIIDENKRTAVKKFVVQ